MPPLLALFANSNILEETSLGNADSFKDFSRTGLWNLSKTGGNQASVSCESMNPCDHVTPDMGKASQTCFCLTVFCLSPLSSLLKNRFYLTLVHPWRAVSGPLATDRKDFEVLFCFETGSLAQAAF